MGLPWKGLMFLRGIRLLPPRAGMIASLIGPWPRAGCWPQIVNFISTASGWDFISLDFFLSIDKPSLTVYNNFLYKTSAFRASGFIIYNIDFLKKNLDSIRHTLPLDLTMTFNKDYIKLIPKEVIVRQHVKKQSETNSTAKTSYYYSVYYRQTEEYLRNYGNDKLSLTRKFSLLRR